MKRVYFAALACLMAIGIMVAISYAWFINSEFVEPDFSGYSISAYFGGGDGSDEDPYQIKNKRHLYNLCWLQYLGYFNQPGSGNVKDEEAETLTQYSFSLEADLDMTNWNLPPLGTSLNPFIGLFNGNGHKIENLTTTNNFSEFGQKHPSTVTSSNFANCNIIGFVGVIGEIDSMDYSGYTFSSTANAVANVKLKNTTVKTTATQSLIGIAAGYINGTMQDVGIVNGNINVAAGTKLANMDNISEYTVAGYAEDDYVTKVSTTKAIVMNPTDTEKTSFVFEDEGNITGWGGSIAMTDMYNRILSARPRDASNTRPNDALTYVRYENRYININKDTIQQEKTQSTSNYDTNQADIFIGTDASGANGYYLKRSVSNGDTYNYLTALYKDVAIIEKTSNIENGYKIKNYNGYYLNFTSTGTANNVNFTTSVTASTDSDSATVWVRSSKNGGYSLYTYSEDDGYKYYLTTTDYSNLSLSTSDTTTWKQDSNYGFYATYNSTNYYMRFISNNWGLSNQKSYYITDGNGNYLTRNGNNITNAPNMANATRWIFENESTKSGIIFDETDTSYKLYLNGANLSVSTSNSTNWSNNGTLLYNGTSFIIFDGTNWTIYHPNQYIIQYNGNYLSLNNDGSINNNYTDYNTATHWTFSDTSSYQKGYISTVINGDTYYLRFNNGTLETTQSYSQSTNWSNDGDGLYYTYNNYKYYLQYKNNSWVTDRAAQKVVGYYISYNNNYLENQQIIFKLNSNNQIYYDDDGTITYLTISRSGSRRTGYTYSLSETTNSSDSHILVKNGNAISGYYDQTGYLYYYNNSWTIQTLSQNMTWTSVYEDDINNTPMAEFDIAITSYQSTTSLINNVVSLENGTINTITRTEQEEPSVFNYIPLNALTSYPYTVDEMNTGYLISGSHETGSGQYADIRVSQYNISNISSSYSNKAWVNNGIRTVGSSGNGYIGSTNYPESKYSKYLDSKSRLLTTLNSNSSYVYGLHFMSASISINHLVVAPEVLINGETKYYYQMPEDCIDFQLATKGIINFFAGYYFTNNNSFFSLHEIIRDADDNITAIKHISYIYKATSAYGENYLSADYIYQYSDGSYSGTYDSNKYEMVFNSSWIETPNVSYNSYKNYLFYFEIPVNKGEFALGSVDGGTGAYLIYLDIGANAQEVDRSIITQKSTVTQYDYIYPNGIAVILEDTTIDNTLTNVSLDASLSSVIRFNSTGTISLSRTSNTVITATASMSITSTYIPRNITLTNNSSAMTASAVKTTTSIYSQIQYIDHNLTTGKIYETNIEKVVTMVDGVVTNSAPPTVKVYDYSEGTEIDITASDAEWKLYGIVIDDSGSNKNRSFVLSSTQDNSDGKASERLSLYNALLSSLSEINDSNDSTNVSVLEYEFDTATNANNTYSIHIDTTLESTTTTTRYYLYDGNTITVTTNNTGGTTIYITDVNTTYTFVINTEQVTAQGTTISVSAS